MTQESQKKQSRFVNPDALEQVDLGEGDWVKIPERLTYADAQSFAVTDKDDKEKVAGFLHKMIRDWNLVDEKGEVAEITEEMVSRLDIKDAMKIVTAVSKKIEAADIPKAE